MASARGGCASTSGTCDAKKGRPGSIFFANEGAIEARSARLFGLVLPLVVVDVFDRTFFSSFPSLFLRLFLPRLDLLFLLRGHVKTHFDQAWPMARRDKQKQFVVPSKDLARFERKRERCFFLFLDRRRRRRGKQKKRASE